MLSCVRRASVVLILAALGVPALAQTALTVRGTTAGQPSAVLPLFGSTPANCQLSTAAEPYDPTPFVVDTDGSYTVAVTEPVSDPAYGGDDTILMVYRDAFDPADACRNFVGIGNETAGSGLTVALAAADGYVLVVGGFFGTEDDYTVTVTGAPGSTVGSGAVASATLTGGPGWRMLAAPSTSETVGGLLGPLWTQGFPGADSEAGDPNVYAYNEAVTTDTDGSGAADLDDGYEAPASASEALPAGKGLFVYAFADDPTTPEAETFPYTIAASGAPPAAPFAFAVSFQSSGDATDDGWNLLGNPFETGLDWSAPGWTKTDMSDAIYVYDPAQNRYLTYSTLTGGELGPVVAAYQGFWAKAMAPGAALQAPEASRITSGGTFYGRRPASEPPVVVFRVSGEVGGQAREDQVRVAFVDGARDAVDPADAYKLAGFGPDALRLYALAATDGGPVGLDISAVPADGATLDIGMDAEVGGARAAGTFVLTWPELRLPTGWVATLTDRRTDTEVDLLSQTSHTFSEEGSGAARQAPDGPLARPGAPQPVRLSLDDARRADGGARFMLRVGPAQSVDREDEVAAAFRLGPAWPNPTRQAATLDLWLPTAETVWIEVFDALGRRIEAVPQRSYAAGQHSLRVVSEGWSPGLYVIRVSAGGAVLSRAFTVLR